MRPLPTQFDSSITVVPPAPELLAPIHSHKDPKDFSEIVSILYPAERAALEAFARLTDQAVVLRFRGTDAVPLLTAKGPLSNWILQTVARPRSHGVHKAQ